MKRRQSSLFVGVVLVLGSIPVAAHASHNPPHDPRPNPNCAWDSSRSSDWNGNGEPDHLVVGASANTSFPRQVVTTVWEPLTGQDSIPPFFGAHDGPDDVTVTVQGDHRMFGANAPHDDEGNPEQLHNGAIRAHLDYDEVEHGRQPRAEAGAGVYEADHLAMACFATDGEPEAAVCPAGTMVFRTDPDEPCPDGGPLPDPDCREQGNSGRCHGAQGGNSSGRS
jgi:hypothetical protein